MISDLELEKLELKYLNKLFYFLKCFEDDMLKGFASKEKIKGDWIKYWEEKGISNFDVGAERIIYSLLNARLIGAEANSNPVASDLFFETNDAFIHIDIKTVQTRNLGDFTTSIFIGRNQNSYHHKMIVNNSDKTEREYIPALPKYYNLQGKLKPCLTYFLPILYEDIDLKILMVNLLCMPNGQLTNIYGKNILKAGKLKNEARFNFSNAEDFKLLKNEKRIKIIYFNNTVILDDNLRKKLNYLINIKNNQKI